jgi:hypothetical protein
MGDDRVGESSDRAYPVGSGPEGKARLEPAKKSCRLGDGYIADVDTVLLGLRA